MSVVEHLDAQTAATPAVHCGIIAAGGTDVHWQGSGHRAQGTGSLRAALLLHLQKYTLLLKAA
jgi:hypothetical protein